MGTGKIRVNWTLFLFLWLSQSSREKRHIIRLDRITPEISSTIEILRYSASVRQVGGHTYKVHRVLWLLRCLWKDLIFIWYSRSWKINLGEKSLPPWTYYKSIRYIEIKGHRVKWASLYPRTIFVVMNVMKSFAVRINFPNV